MTDAKEGKITDENLDSRLDAMSSLSPELIRSLLNDNKFLTKIHSSIKSKFGEQRIMISIGIEEGYIKIMTLTNVDIFRDTVPKVAEAFDTYRTQDEVVFLIMEPGNSTIETYQVKDKPKSDS